MPLRPYKLVYPKYTASQLSANFSFQTFVLDTVKLNRGHLRMLRKGRDAVRQWNMIVNGLFSKDKKKRKKLVNEGITPESDKFWMENVCKLAMQEKGEGEDEEEEREEGDEG